MIGKKQLSPFVTGILAIILTILLLIPLGPLPPLKNFFDPQHGLWGMAGYAEVPSDQTIVTDLITNNITVYRDEWGVPHIYAHSDWDLYYAIGYCQAQDRLWQMDILRRMYSGKVSEILGSDALDSDIYFRTLGLMKTARETLHWYQTNEPNSPWLRAIEAYAAGVNYYVDHMSKDEIPYEFLLLNYEPKSPFWDPIDTLGFGGFMSFDLAHDGFRDLKLAVIQDQLGQDAIDELYPLNNTYGMIPIIPDFGECRPPTVESNKRQINHEKGYPLSVLQEFRNVLQWNEKLQNLPKFLKFFEPALKLVFGSNNWVVDGTKSATGKPILAGDTHLAWFLPPIWYEAHLVNLNSDYNDYGLSFPGEPFIVPGHTEYIAREFTNVGADVLDYYYYKINSDGTKYWNDSQSEWVAFDTYEERIKVKGDSDYILKVNYTAHGPVLNEVREEMVHGVEQYTTPVAMRWVALQTPNTLLKAVYSMARAHNLDEFRDEMKDWNCPAQNVVFASIDSDIAMLPVANYPVRPNGYWGRFPCNGSAGEGEWQGYIPYDEQPISINPSQHYLASCNQKTAGQDYPYYLGWMFDPGYRTRRINELFSSKDKITFEDMKNFQLDINDSAAQAFVPHILKSIEAPSGSKLADAVSYLENWNYIMEKDEVAPLLYAKWLQVFINETFNDEWENIDAPFIMPMLNQFEYLMIQNASHNWFDDAGTL
ncbi:MAG: penicillin acylase family protein, partial [Promethearchaeota archaeon]